MPAGGATVRQAKEKRASRTEVTSNGTISLLDGHNSEWLSGALPVGEHLRATTSAVGLRLTGARIFSIRETNKYNPT